jgi:hypothetical protein
MENMLSSVVDIKVSPGSKERKAMMPRRDAFVSVKRPATSETKKENSPTSRLHAQISEVKKLKHNINSSTRCTCVHPSDLSQLLKIICKLKKCKVIQLHPKFKDKIQIIKNKNSSYNTF